MTCCVPRCYHKARVTKSTTKPDGRKVTFHCIPSCRKKVLRQKWFDAISSGKIDFVITPKSKVCSIHFSEDMFYSGAVNNRRLLRSDAIPRIFAWGNYSSVDQLQTDDENMSAEMYQGQSNDMDMMCPTTNQAQTDDADTTTATYMYQEMTDSEDTGAATCIVSKVISKTSDGIKMEDTTEVEELTCLEGSIDETANVNEESDCKYTDLTKEVITLQEQCIFLEKKVQNLESENNKLQLAVRHRNKTISSKNLEIWKKNIKVKLLEKKVKLSSPNIEEMNDDNLKFYTGMPNHASLMALFEFLNPDKNCQNVQF